MKKTVLFTCMIMASFLHAESNNYNTLSKQGLTIPDSGVNVVPINQIKSIPDDVKSLWVKQNQEQKEKGYYFELTPRPKELLNLHNEVAQHYKKYETNTTPTSTHMRHKIDEIHMAYVFKEVPRSEVTNLIGFAPVGGYKNGWTGVVEFFDVENLGSCAYTENNMKIAHGAERVAEELSTRRINGKVTTVDIKGSPTSGFLYTIYWSDNDYFRQLECANMKYSKNTTNAVIELAKQIDNQ